jgi:hypothetical protein
MRRPDKRFLLDPAGKLLHALGRNVPREEVGRVREVCRERAYKDKFPEIIRMLDTNKSGKLLATVSPHATP